MSKNKISSSKHRKGSFASQAKRAGMSLPKFANYVIRNYRDETSSYNPTIKTYRRAIYYKDTIPNRKSKRGKTKRRKMKARMEALLEVKLIISFALHCVFAHARRVLFLFLTRAEFFFPRSVLQGVKVAFWWYLFCCP